MQPHNGESDPQLKSNGKTTSTPPLMLQTREHALLFLSHTLDHIKIIKTIIIPTYGRYESIRKRSCSQKNGGTRA